MIKPLLTPEWFSRFSRCNRLIVGFSGGLDSTILLHVLASYPILHTKLLAVHVNHGISAHAPDWQSHCEQFCESLGIDLITQTVHFDRSANVEERARIARYEVFSSLITEHDCVILGHHLDDQAETVLLQLFRGAGVDGLAAMAEISLLGVGTLARPFLGHSRGELENYAALHDLHWIEDESNQDNNYSRNYLRHQIIPLLRAKWPGVVGNIARTATHCQQAKSNLDVLAESDVAIAGSTLFIEPLERLNFDRIANILRVWLKNNQVQLPSTVTFHRLINEVICANQDASPEVRWGEILVRRYQKHLYLDRTNVSNPPLCLEWSEFPAPLVWGNTGTNLLAKKAKQGLVIPPGTKILVRLRQGGEDLFWHGQTKCLKKLLQEWEIPPWLRERVPLVYFNDELAAVVGYAMSDLFFTKESSHAWVLTAVSAK